MVHSQGLLLVVCDLLGSDGGHLVVTRRPAPLELLRFNALIQRSEVAHEESLFGVVLHGRSEGCLPPGSHGLVVLLEAFVESEELIQVLLPFGGERIRICLLLYS